MNTSDATKALKKYFGYETFRPGQSEIIQAVYDRKDTLVLMPTGGGKSICFQVPAITMPGTCVVVSPLISLMKDQVDGLLANGIRAAALNSSLNHHEQRDVEDRFFRGELDLLYVSPEKIVSQGFLPLLQRASVSLFAIDEAHCISSWGHDFRPEYTQMRFLKQTFKDTPIIALTATADRLTRQDIISQLKLQDPEVFISSFDRPNLSLTVRPGQKRIEQMLDFIAQRPRQSGIVYCLSRKNTEELAAKLSQKGIKAAPYHAGMPDDARARTQEDFLNDRTPVICATIAFGMGIDKSNVRWVIHYNLPKNIEGYYQEIGRAGRDGAKADTLLFYSYQDVIVMEEILRKNGSGNEEIQLVKLERMRQYAEAPTCRRRILLSYFSEDLGENCGNCDICQSPPQYIDGTQIAQKALSAVYRMREEVGSGLLIDVLRGSGRRDIIDKGYHLIKTYGAGRDYSQYDWQYFVTQLINLGYIEVAHEQRHALRLTEASKRVLFNGEQVQLARPTPFGARAATTTSEGAKAPKSKASAAAPPRLRARNELFDVLKQLRLHVSQEQGVPPYIVFSDATLEEMAAMQPTDELQMSRISGVGEQKLNLYGDTFIQAITAYLAENPHMAGTPAADTLVAPKPKPEVELPKPLGLSTSEFTGTLLQAGMSIDEVARKRGLSTSTIVQHMHLLREAGQEIDLLQYITKTEIRDVRESLPALEKPVKAKDIFEHLEGAMGYEKIRLALMYLGQYP